MKNHIQDLYNYLTEKKCRDIAVYDLSKEEQSYEYIVLLTVSSPLNNKKFAQEIMKDFQIETFPEGYNKGEWIIFDFDQVIVHAFTPQTREKYNLDRLWQSKKMMLK